MPTSARHGAKREAQRFFAGRVRFFILLVGADDSVRPLKCFEFASDFRKNGRFRRADRVVRPYDAKWEINTDSPENRHKTTVSCGSMWASTPTARNGKPARFRRRHGAAVPAAHKTKDTPIPAGRKPRDESIRDTSWCHPGSEDARPPFSRADGAEPGDFGGCTPYTHARRMSFALCAAGASQQNGSLSDRHAAVLLPRHCR